MSGAKRAGKCRAIGVSNFGAAQLEALLRAGGEVPDVNQIELHPWLQQQETVACCRAHGIVVMGYCPLARSQMFGCTKLCDLATAWGRTEVECLLRWALQKSFVAIPKSSSPERIATNAGVFAFELNEAQMESIDALDIFGHFKATTSVNSMETPWGDVA